MIPHRECVYHPHRGSWYSGIMDVMEVFVDTQEEMMREAARFFKTRCPKKDEATLIALSGNLGAGKTTYVKGVALSGGITHPVTSPTFVFMKEYRLPEKENTFENLIHIDAYRMEEPQMLHTIVPKDIFADPQNIIFLEWPQRVGNVLPRIACTISIETLSGTRRRIIYDDNQ
mgnify:CR=1 FL=1